MNDPDRGHMSYIYDDANNLIRTVDAKSQTIRYEYDGVNRLLAEYYGAATEADVQYYYDTPFGAVTKNSWKQETLADLIASPF